MRKFVIGAVAGATVLAGAGIATAGENDGVQWDLNYSTTKSKSSTALEARIDSTGTADSTGKPRAARTVTITFARGTKFDPKARPTCDPDDLRTEGPSGCTRRSKIGDGEGEAVSGLASIDPIPLSIEAFNGPRNTVLFYVRGSGPVPVTLTLEGTLRGRTLRVEVPRQPLPTPFGEAILTKFGVDIDRYSSGRGRNRRHFAVSPSSCPTGRWTTQAVFQYDDGRVTVRDTDRCRRTRR